MDLKWSSEALLAWILDPFLNNILAALTLIMVAFMENSSHFKSLPFPNYWGHCAPGNTQSFRLLPLLWSMPCHNFIVPVSIEFLKLCITVLVLTVSVICGTLYRRTGFLNYVQLIQFGFMLSSRLILVTITVNHSSEFHKILFFTKIRNTTYSKCGISCKE